MQLVKSEKPGCLLCNVNSFCFSQSAILSEERKFLGQYCSSLQRFSLGAWWRWVCISPGLSAGRSSPQHWRKYCQDCLLNLAWDYVPDSSSWQRIILLQMSIVLWNLVIDETLGLERLSIVGEDHIILNFAPLYRVWRAWIFFSNTISFMHWDEACFIFYWARIEVLL